MFNYHIETDQTVDALAPVLARKVPKKAGTYIDSAVNIGI